jgi:1,4-dihydroxy-2-naphthoate polyprenyltransferase
MTDVGDRVPSPHVAPRSSLVRNWRYVLRTSNPPPGRIDPVSRWLVLTRASVLPMTITAAAIAGLLAAFADEPVRWWLFTLAAAGLVLAHVANNLMNDLFDLDVGVDSDSYPRALYAPHPVLSGTITRHGLLVAALVVNAIDLAILCVLFAARGWPVVAFALGGFLLSFAYAAPPLRLKKHGLGEPTVLVVWGPLMVGGTYYAATGHLPISVVVASLPYALLCTAVLMGKHIDKIPWDARDGTRTLPVVLGERAARGLTQGMMVSFYVLVALLVGLGTLPIAALLVVFALPKLVTIWTPFSEPKPSEPPEGFPIWPLWFAALAFIHTRRAGGLLVLGLIVGVILGW